MSLQSIIRAITPRQVSAMKKQEIALKASADPQALLPTLSGSTPKVRRAFRLPQKAGWRFGVALLKDVTSVSLLVVVRDIGE